MNKLPLYTAFRYFRTRKKNGVISLTSLITVIGVFLGTFAILVSLSILNGFQNVIFNRATDMEAQVRIDERHRTEEDAQKDADFLAAQDSQFLWSPVLERKLLIHSGGENRAVLVRGVSPRAYGRLVNLQPYLFNHHFLTDDLSQTEMPEIVIGVGIANQLGLHSGDTLSILDIMGSDKGLPPTLDCRIADIFQVDIFDYDLQYAYLHIDDMRYLLDDPGRDYLAVSAGTARSCAPGKFPESLRPRLRYWQDDHRELFAAMQIEKAGSFLVLNLIVLLAGFNLVASLMLLLLEKRWETGILKAMGMGPGDAMKSYFYLGWINGGLGLAAGLLVALPLLLIQEYFPFIPLPQDVYFIPWLPVQVQLSDILVTVLSLSVIISLSSLIPAFRVNRQKPLQAIREKN